MRRTWWDREKKNTGTSQWAMRNRGKTDVGQTTAGKGGKRGVGGEFRHRQGLARQWRSLDFISL